MSGPPPGSSSRRSAAPRLLAEGPDRLVPWSGDAAAVHEHLHRYLWGRELVAGRRVLDLGSGEGYGAALLAEVASAVDGVDRHATAVEHARLTYAAETLTFTHGDTRALGHVPDATVGAVVAFGLLERVADPAAQVAEIARVLAPDGLLVASVPRHGAGPSFSEPALRELLRPAFPHVALLGQRAGTGTVIEPLDEQDGPRAGTRHRVERTGDTWRPAAPATPTSLLAVASRVALPQLGGSSLTDHGGAPTRPRRTPADLLGRGRRRRPASVAPAAPAPAVPEVEATVVAPRIVLPHPAATPDVSIVIPVHDGVELTERCLQAIVASTGTTTYEVVVVLDTDDPAVVRLLEVDVQGAVVLRNETNLGYLRSVNRGASAARGTHIAHLNNDTEPQPGWLDALVARLESADDIGVVAGRLLFPDGRLQEAGSIIWSDGSGWNYGKGEDEGDPAYGFPREIDYGSAAALLVRGSLWRELGGFDERYAPAYYEDADLCFAARERGFRVLYEPAARVVHVHGASMGEAGTGTTRGLIDANAHAFRERWADALAQQTPGSGGRVVAASDRRRGRRVVVVDHTVPVPDQDAGSVRLLAMIENLLALGRRVTFLPGDRQAPGPYTQELQGRGVEVLYGPVDVPARLRQIADETELAILCRPSVAASYLPLIREALPHARVAYDTVDLHHVREARRAAVDPGLSAAVAASLREIELGVARASDVTLVVSGEEAAALHAADPVIPVEVVGLVHEAWADVPGRAAREGLLFVGNFAHAPNADAVEQLVRRVMPLVWRKHPELRLTVAGPNPSPALTELSSPRVSVLGWVPDLDAHLRTAVALVAPLRYGAGVKGKLTQALAAGLPAVTTAVGAEGIVDGGPGVEALLLGETPPEIAARVLALLDDEALWERTSAAGQVLVRRRFGAVAQRGALARVLAATTDVS